MKIYRQRNIIEQGFQQLKNEVGGDRLRATETTYRGKIFLYSLKNGSAATPKPSC